MAKGDTTKPRSECPCKIPHRVPPFLATPLACCFESLRIKRQYDLYYCHRALVILMYKLRTVTNWMSAPIFLKRRLSYRKTSRLLLHRNKYSVNKLVRKGTVLQYGKNSGTVTYGILVRYGIMVRYFL